VPLNTIEGDLYVAGYFAAQGMTVPGNAVTDASVRADAAIQCTKLQQQPQPVYAQPQGSAVATERKPIWVARGAGTIESLRVGVAVAAVGAATVTVQLKKNGANVLSAAVTIDNTTAAYAKLLGSFSDATYVDGDVFEVDVTATAGGGTLPKGLFVSLTPRGSAQ
jgi:hypothetical protein